MAICINCKNDEGCVVVDVTLSPEGHTDLKTGEEITLTTALLSVVCLECYSKREGRRS